MAYDVWMMEGGVTKSFTKVSTFSYNTDDYVTARGFRKSGEHIIEIVECNRGHLVGYKPHLENIDNLGIYGVLEFMESWNLWSVGYIFCSTLHGNTIFA
ncbi:hypothetical protein Hanom_Chr16g01479911 [Helianthus anomalus]